MLNAVQSIVHTPASVSEALSFFASLSLLNVSNTAFMSYQKWAHLYKNNTANIDNFLFWLIDQLIFGHALYLILCSYEIQAFNADAKGFYSVAVFPSMTILKSPVKSSHVEQQLTGDKFVCTCSQSKVAWTSCQLPLPQ